MYRKNVPGGERPPKWCFWKFGVLLKWTCFFIQSLPEAVQNHVQNHDFSENPRWGPYKNHKLFTKTRYIRGTLRKTWIFMFWTATITYTRQFGARAEKSWFLHQKCSELLIIIKSEHVFYSIASWSCSKPCSKPWFFRKSSMGTVQKSQNVH